MHGENSPEDAGDERRRQGRLWRRLELVGEGESKNGLVLQQHDVKANTVVGENIDEERRRRADIDTRR